MYLYTQVDMVRRRRRAASGEIGGGRGVLLFLFLAPLFARFASLARQRVKMYSFVGWRCFAFVGNLNAGREREREMRRNIRATTLGWSQYYLISPFE